MGQDAEKKVAEFPDVQNKLHAPTKKSLFERQKAEAEAKRLREEAETKAVYEDFVKSFDDEDEAPGGGGGFGRDDHAGRFGGGGFGGGGISGPPKRHYTHGGMGAAMNTPSGPAAGRGYGSGGLGNRGMNSGLGSLGPPPPSLGRKRPSESFSQTPSRRDRDDRGILAFEDDDDEQDRTPAKVFNTSEDEDERAGTQGGGDARAVSKPTLKLASLPPGTSPAVIKALLPPNLIVDAVRISPNTSGVYTERRSMSAIVALAKDTAANDIDAAVNSLQNRYLGFGYYLNLHRHLSSAAISTPATSHALGTSTASQPFGAKPVPVAPAGRGHAPPPHQRGGFAPPSSYGPGPGPLSRGTQLLHVPVQAPQDIRELKLIHKVIESLLKHGPEFEALLMSRPDVQREEKWAWLWDPRSTGGVWYRWRLWEVLTGSTTRRGQGKYLPLFEGSSAWKAPDRPLPYEYTTRLDEFVSDSEYNSSDEDDSGDEGAKRLHHTGAPPDTSALADDGRAYLNPLEKAKLTHLLARLPTSNGQLRKGDVARVTAFAISHAGQGADEVVSMIISNIERPFAYTSANPNHRKDKDTSGNDGPAAGEEEETSDTSSASLIGIYIINDILSSSSTSGVRHAWRYRQLFESALRQQHTFEGLGRMERKMNWGRLRAEKWKRSVGNILSLWEGWCVFPQASQEHFVHVFNNPPLTAAEEAEAKKREDEEKAAKGKNRWRAVELAPKEELKKEDADGVPMAQDEDVDGEPMAEDEDIDGVPMEEDEDVDGVPMEDVDGDPMDEDTQPASAPEHPHPKETKLDTAPVGQRRQRPKAVDMFADSDDDDS